MLDDPRWYVVRNGIVLLTVIGEPVPRALWPRLAGAQERQVRLALAQEVSRWSPHAGALDVLVPLLDDADAGVRFTAALALGSFPAARAKRALARRSCVKHDRDVWNACAAGLRRRADPAPT